MEKGQIMASDCSKVEVKIQSEASAKALQVFAEVTEEEAEECGGFGFDDLESFTWIDVDEDSVISFEKAEWDFAIGFGDLIPKTLKDVPNLFRSLAKVGFLGDSLVASCWPAIDGLPSECKEASIICQDLFCEDEIICYTGTLKVESGVCHFLETADENDLYNEIIA